PPGSTVRYAETTFHVGSGKATHAIRPPAFSYPAGAIQPPPAYGDIIPFRYLELIGLPKTLRITDVRQLRLLSTFDTNAASFTSSSSALDEVWNLCRNTMQVLTFDGIYVDGDRERKPYESDAYIHQLSSYAVDREFTMPRYSLEYLLQNPTWPTEWKFHDIFMAWADYVQTGEASLLRRHYSELRADSFEWAAPGGALMKGFPNFPQKTNSDVVDWPACDRDGFIIGDGPNLNWTNSVNNALYYHGLRLMANIAAAIGRTNEAARYSTRSAQVYTAYNTAFWNDVAKCYMDGVGVDHASAHANFFPLAFGLVPPSRQPAVLSFLHSRIASHGGMPCSVYAAQYLLEALFTAGDADTAIGLITTNGPRGWLNMITLGSTLTTEAWNFRDKPNMDWNHAWGAAPGNLIARFILGLRPLVPGFGKVLIQPRLGTTLLYADGTIPTIRGPVSICVSNAPASFQMRLNIPGNVTATVMLPAAHATKAVAVVDGKMLSGALSNNWLVLKNIGAGRHVIELERTTTPPSPGFYAKQGAASFHESTAEPVVAHPAADPPDEGTSH
ncbi:MAG TPA: alpha-L-rhamnosidase C-terminal domain-containing protein, partial [Verrucomicrobiae bacterium]|nr:alpha-L-rhamnosidase C-terminal domain-containing protein [Verrucomicrobiae bacterium]